MGLYFGEIRYLHPTPPPPGGERLLSG
jgi:hypothetical protein